MEIRCFPPSFSFIVSPKRSHGTLDGSTHAVSPYHRYHIQVAIRRVVRATHRMTIVVTVLPTMTDRTDPLVAITRIVIIARDATGIRDPDEATARRKTVTDMEEKRRQANETTVLNTNAVKALSDIGDGAVCCEEREKVLYGCLIVVVIGIKSQVDRSSNRSFYKQGSKPTSSDYWVIDSQGPFHDDWVLHYSFSRTVIIGTYLCCQYMRKRIRKCITNCL